jgi:hypothetical protein
MKRLKESKMRSVYEIWEMVSFGPGEPAQPFFLIEKSDNFNTMYDKYKKISKEKSCVIICSKQNKVVVNQGDDKKYIFESPDNGKTVYRRKFGDIEGRELVSE